MILKMKISPKIFFCALFIGAFFSFGELRAEVKIQSPASGDTIYCGQALQIRWTDDHSGPYEIYYTDDSWKTFRKVAESVEKNYFDWQIPFSKSENAEFAIERFKLAQPELIFEIENAHSQNEVLSVDFSPAGDKILSAGDDNFIKIWSVSDNSLQAEFSTAPSALSEAEFSSFSADSGIAAAASKLYKWGAPSYALIDVSGAYFSETVKSVAYHPNMRVAAAGSYGGKAAVFDLATGVVLAEYALSGGSEIYSVAFSSDGKFLLLSGSAGSFYIANWKDGSPAREFAGHGNPNGSLAVVRDAQAAYDSKRAISGGVDNTSRIWDIQSGELVKTIDEAEFHIRKIDVRASGVFLTSSLDGKIRQYYIESGLAVCDPIEHGAAATWGAYSPGGDSIATCGRDNAIRLWKNYRIERSADTASTIYRYKIELSIPEVYATPGDRLSIPVRRHKRCDAQETESTQFAFLARITIPNRALDAAGDNVSRSSGRRDTIIFRYDGIGLQDTIFAIRALAITSDKDFEEIQFAEVSIDEPKNLAIETSDGAIFTNARCEGETGRNAAFGEPTGIKASPNPAKEEIFVELNLLEDGAYALNIIDARGDVAKRVFTEKLKSGKRNFTIDLRDLTSGAYLLDLTTPSGAVSKKFYIVK